METTVRDSVGGMAKISILNTSYFWPDDVAHMESETKSETVPLLWKLGFLAGQQHHLRQQQHNQVFWPFVLPSAKSTRVPPFMAG